MGLRTRTPTCLAWLAGSGLGAQLPAQVGWPSKGEGKARQWQMERVTACGASTREWRGMERLLWFSSTLADRGKSKMEVAAIEVGALCMVATFQTRVAL